MELNWGPTGGVLGRTLLIQVLLILKYACRKGMGCLIFQRWWTEGPSELPPVNVVFRYVLPERTFGSRVVLATWPAHACTTTEGWSFVRNTWGAAELGREADSAAHTPVAVDGDAPRFCSAASVQGCCCVDHCSRASGVRHETTAAPTSRTSTHQRRQCGLLQTLHSPCIVLVSPRRLTHSGPEQSLAQQFRNCRRLRLSGIRFALFQWTACTAEAHRSLPQDFRHLWLWLTTTGTTSMT